MEITLIFARALVIKRINSAWPEILQAMRVDWWQPISYICLWIRCFSFLGGFKQLIAYPLPSLVRACNQPISVLNLLLL